jgi:hypothetical protein
MSISSNNITRLLTPTLYHPNFKPNSLRKHTQELKPLNKPYHKLPWDSMLLMIANMPRISPLTSNLNCQIPMGIFFCLIIKPTQLLEPIFSFELIPIESYLYSETNMNKTKQQVI